MSQTTRIREIIAILESSKHPVPVSVLLEKTGMSRSTFKRDIEVLKHTMQAPIVWKRGDHENARGYVLDDKGWSSGSLGLPRAWFTAAEIYALLMIDELASHIGPGLLSEHIQPLLTRVTMALSAADDVPGDVRSRVRIIASASKRKASPQFETVAQSTIKREQLIISYFTRSTNSHSLRTVSPQRLIYYRENWYLIAWCHKADGLRMFALDAIDNVEEVKAPALDVKQDRIDAMIGDNFGLYSGHDRQWARLKFSAIQARWAQAEIWHLEQKSTSLDDGSYILEVPYSNNKELILEILRFGKNIEVLAPVQLRNDVIEQLKQALAQY